MPKDNRLAQLLNDCLDQVQQGQLSVEDCLSQQAELAQELRPLLAAAARAQQLAPGGPSAQFRAGARARLLNLARAQGRQPRAAAARTRRLRWRPAYALGAVLLTLVLLGGGAGVAYASGDALPGDSLYGVKRGVEQLALTLTLDDAGDSRLLLRHAGRRVAEVRELLRAGRLGDLDSAVSGYQSAVDQALALGDAGSGELAALEQALGQHELALNAALQNAPAPAVPALQAALIHAEHGRQIVEQIRSGADPSQLAPGQLKKSTGEDPSGNLSPGQLKQRRDQVPPGQLKKQDVEDEGLEDLPPGQLKRNACRPDRPGGGPPSPELCGDQ